MHTNNTKKAKHANKSNNNIKKNERYLKRLQTHKPTQDTLPYRPSPQIERKHIQTHANDYVHQLAQESKIKTRPHSLYIHENNSQTRSQRVPKEDKAHKSPQQYTHHSTTTKNATDTHKDAKEMKKKF